MALQHLRSSTANKRPTPAAMSDGQIALNSNTASPGLFFKDSAGALIKVGPVHVGTTAPNASPASGGQTGNTVGEQWLDTTGGTYVFKVWDGSAWRSETGTFVDVNGDTMTGALGIIAGSAATPGLFVSGDTNTGIYSPGADQLAISTNGAGRLFVDASGNVGVNTSSQLSPGGFGYARALGMTGATSGDSSVALDLRGSRTISGSFADINFWHQSTSNRAYIQARRGSSDSAIDLDFITSGGAGMRLDSSGRLGLGTSSPSSLLTLGGNDITGSSQKITYKAGSTDAASIEFVTEEGGVNRDAGIKLNVMQNNSLFTLLYAEGTNGGRVGIGTTSAGSLLSLKPASGGGIEVQDTGGTARAFATLTGSPDYSAKIKTSNYYLDLEAVQASGGQGHIRFFTGTTTATQRAAIDSSGRLLVGTSSDASGGNANALLQCVASGPGTFVVGRSDGSTTSGDTLGNIFFRSYAGSVWETAASIQCVADATQGSGDKPSRLVFSTTADGASSPTERMTIDSAGLVVTKGSSTEGDEIFQAQGGGTGALRVFKVNSLGNNTAAAATWIRKNSSTDRSINAAGTVNASGADYAEYMAKAGDFTIAKGDICGINPNGKLTNVFANAVGFVVKSTDPSYVGGDSWGADIEDPVQLETERQKVDRIAFAGQVPVNVMDASPGQYIVPMPTTQGGITGIAKDEADLTLAEYMRAVGKVIAIEDDGRARIIVKVA